MMKIWTFLGRLIRAERKDRKSVDGRIIGSSICKVYQDNGELLSPIV